MLIRYKVIVIFENKSGILLVVKNGGDGEGGVVKFLFGVLKRCILGKV